MSKEYPIYLAGDWVTSSERLEVRNPYTGEILGTTFQATGDQLNTAIEAAEQAFDHLRNMPVFDRVSLSTRSPARCASIGIPSPG